MTIQELIKSGDKKRIKQLDEAMSLIRQRDSDSKVFVIKTYLICQIIAYFVLGILLIIKFA